MLKLAIGLEEFNRELTGVKILKLKEVVRVGIESEIPLIKYNNFLFTSSCIVEACDMKSPTRDVKTVCKQGIYNKHPSEFSLADNVRMSVDERIKHKGELQNAVKRHNCCMYCLRDAVCRFGFPLPLIEKTHIMIEEKCVET